MVSSVLYHHIIGSNAQTFGELTKDVIQQHPGLTKSYLSVIQSQTKYQNNYFIGNYNTLDELKEFVEKNDVPPIDFVDAILKSCYSFAFSSDNKDIYKGYSISLIETTETQKQVQNTQGLPSLHVVNNGKTWDELNNMYQNYDETTYRTRTDSQQILFCKKDNQEEPFYHHERWTEIDDIKLCKLCKEKATFEEMANVLGRSKGAIIRRLSLLSMDLDQLKKEYDDAFNNIKQPYENKLNYNTPEEPYSENSPIQK